jgi:hypothetical protein
VPVIPYARKMGAHDCTREPSAPASSLEFGWLDVVAVPSQPARVLCVSKGWQRRHMCVRFVQSREGGEVGARGSMDHQRSRAFVVLGTVMSLVRPNSLHPPLDKGGVVGVRFFSGRNCRRFAASYSPNLLELCNGGSLCSVVRWW